MNFKFLIFIIMLCYICFSNSFTFTSHTYPHTAQVVGINYHSNTVIVKTSTGIFYTFYGTEDYMIGDLVSLTMDTRGTTENVVDDMIVQMQYSGYTTT